jgi:hypothetical protein
MLHALAVSDRVVNGPAVPALCTAMSAARTLVGQEPGVPAPYRFVSGGGLPRLPSWLRPKTAATSPFAWP